jgi:ADP-heptose:LPS heptosyltransferase
MSIIRTSVALFYYVLDSLFQAKIRPNKLDASKRALIVRLDNIGDFVLWRNSAQELIVSLHHRGYQVTLCANSSWADLAKVSLPADQVISVDRGKLAKSFRYRLGVRQLLSQGGFELAINPVYSRELLFGDALIRASRAQRRVGCQGDLSNLTRLEKFFADRIYTRLIEIPELAIHEITKSIHFLSALGVNKVPDTRPYFGALTLTRKFPLPNNYAVLSVSASWQGKVWPLERFKALSDWLEDSYNLTTVIVGGKSDVAVAEQVLEGRAGLNLSGKTALSELPSILGGAKVVISNDASPIHFAFAAGANAICILGGGHFGRFIPFPNDIDDGKPVPIAVHASMGCFGCNWRCRYSRLPGEPVRCIENISLEMVKTEVLKILGPPPVGAEKVV